MLTGGAGAAAAPAPNPAYSAAAAPAGGAYGANAYPPAAPAPATATPSGGAWTGGYGSGASTAANSSKPIIQTNQNVVVTPSQGLNPYTNRWTIKARISNKSEMKSWSNAKGTGTLFSIELIDSSKTEIRGTFFKAAAEKWYPVLKQGAVYLCSGGKIKPVANRQFTNLKNEYEITFDEHSTFEEAADDADISQQAYNFVKIGAIANVEPNTTCDVIAVVKNVSDLQTIVSAKLGNKELYKRDLTIMDDTNTEIKLTLWGANAQNEDVVTWGQIKPIVAFKGVKVGDFSGRSLSLLQSGSIQLSPEIPEGHALAAFVQSHGGDINGIQTGNLSAGGAGGSGARDTFENRKKCMYIKEAGLGMGDKADFIQCKLSLVYAKIDNDPWYTACANKTQQCKKKVTEETNGGWRCEKCNITEPDCIRRYILSTQMADYSGSDWFSFFDEQAKILFDGKSADEMHAIRSEHGEEAYRAVCNKSLFKQFIVKAKVKNEDMGGMNAGESRVKNSVYTVEKLDYKTECSKMIDAINKY